MSAAPAFEANGLAKSYGAICALNGVSFSIPTGMLCGLIGPNGSGKTTLFDCSFAQTAPDAGSVSLHGDDATRLPMDRIAREGGAVRSFQRTSVFGSMSVEENVIAAAQLRVAPGLVSAFFRARRGSAAQVDLNARAEMLLKMVDLAHMRATAAKELSYGQQKLLQFVSAVAPRPRLILLDEPFAGVNPVMMERMTELIRFVNRETGATFLIIEHNVDALVALCARIMVLHQGRLIADGTPAEILRDPVVMEAYLGG